MPAQPTWFRDLERICREVEALPRPFVDRDDVERLLGLGRRRAQQILAPCVSGYIGSSSLASREVFLAHLRRLAAGEAVHYEQQRRRKVARVLDQLHRERIEQPQLLVEAPVQIVNQAFENLPPGVSLGPGSVNIEFQAPQEALEKLLALAMAISNDFEAFERCTRRTEYSTER